MSMHGKRALDIVVGTMLGIIALPVILVSAILVAASLRYWPFFTQERVGYGGQRFRIVKLRTLPPDTPKYASKYIVRNVTTPWFPRMLRRLHLDELPQLYLVVLGHMSLVGPRPEMPQLHDRFDRSFAETRAAVRPGCFGLWQLSRDSDRLIGESPEYDLFYVRHRSFRLDLFVLLRSVRVLSGGYRIGLEDVPTWALADADDAIVLPHPATMVAAPMGERVLELSAAEG
jgi:lipopolysaccharide/colanic/teichoic acid biosynthesis glycosyltransferase